MKKLSLHWKILIGMALGVLFGFIMSNVNGGGVFISDWIKPFGTIFINSLKLIAIPLILASLIKGVSDLKDISKLSSMGGITITTYLMTTVVAVSVGLLLVNIIKPGESISEKTRTELIQAYDSDAEKKRSAAAENKNSGPLQPLIDLVPSNITLSLLFDLIVNPSILISWVGISYERLFAKAKIGVKIPVSVSFINYDYYNYNAKMQTGLDFNYYPMGQKTVTFYTGLSTRIGKINQGYYYYDYDPYYSSYYYPTESNFISLYVNNGLLVHFNDHFSISGQLGLGVRNIYTNNQSTESHVNGELNASFRF